MAIPGNMWLYDDGGALIKGGLPLGKHSTIGKVVQDETRRCRKKSQTFNCGYVC